MKYSVCIDAVYKDKSPSDAMKAVYGEDIEAIEFWAWWNKDIDEILSLKKELDLDIAAFCTRFISLVEEEKRKDYLDGLKESIQIAKKLGTKILITQVGNELNDRSRKDQEESLVEGLKEASKILEKEKITLVFEPLNILVNHKGYFLWSSKEAFEICAKVNSPNVKVLFDIYHQQISEGNLISNITANIDKIGHFHCAGNPGRNELYRGEINYKQIFRAIRKSGYKGFIGLEYFPLEDPSMNLWRLPDLEPTGKGSGPGRIKVI